MSGNDYWSDEAATRDCWQITGVDKACLLHTAALTARKKGYAANRACVICFPTPRNGPVNTFNSDENRTLNLGVAGSVSKRPAKGKGRDCANNRA